MKKKETMLFTILVSLASLHMIFSLWIIYIAWLLFIWNLNKFKDLSRKDQWGIFQFHEFPISSLWIHNFIFVDWQFTISTSLNIPFILRMNKLDDNSQWIEDIVQYNRFCLIYMSYLLSCSYYGFDKHTVCIMFNANKIYRYWYCICSQVKSL
jgi:hypothetical protein